MQLFKIHTGLIKPNQDIIKEIILSLDNLQINIEDNDILAITSKIISLSQGRIVKLEEVKPSDLALKLSKKYNDLAVQKAQKKADQLKEKASQLGYEFKKIDYGEGYDLIKK